jgi:hypothetical protein
VLCWFLDAGNNETVRTLSSPASKKRQGTKSREVGHWLAANPRKVQDMRDLMFGEFAKYQVCSECYGDLMLAPILMMGGTPARRQLHVCRQAMSGECNRHFGVCSERINGRSADWWM